MSRIRVYLKTFNSDFTYQDSWTEITNDVTFNDLSEIRQQIDDEDYNVGVFKVSDFRIIVRNEDGKYSEVGSEKTYFKYRRADSLVRVTWEKQNVPTLCGVSQVGACIAGNLPVVIYEGLLNDDSAQADIRDQQCEFRILGKESIFDRVQAPVITNGMTAKAVLSLILNVSDITDLLTYDVASINPGTNPVIDQASKWDNVTVDEVLSDVLKLSNSVLYIQIDGLIVVRSRAAGALAATFYGQASDLGTETVMNLDEIRSGLGQTFNFWTWDDSTVLVKSDDSIAFNGVRKNTISYDQVTNDFYRGVILAGLLSEFAYPKLTFTLRVPFREDFLTLQFLDAVNVDYPTVFYAADTNGMPIYGVSVYGQARYPVGVWSFTLNTNQHFKIMGRSIEPKTQTIEFKLREV